MSSQINLRFDVVSNSFSMQRASARAGRSAGNNLYQAAVESALQLPPSPISNVLATRSVTVFEPSSSSVAAEKTHYSESTSSPKVDDDLEAAILALERSAKEECDQHAIDFVSVKRPVAHDRENFETRLFTTSERLKVVPLDYHFCPHTRQRTLEPDVNMAVLPEDLIILKALQTKIRTKFSEKFVQKKMVSEARAGISFGAKQTYHSEMWSFALEQVKLENKGAYNELYQRWKTHVAGYSSISEDISIDVFERRFWKRPENRDFHTVMKGYQQQFIAFEEQASMAELSSMLEDYKKHIFARFPLFLRAHYCFLEGYKVVYECLNSSGNESLKSQMRDLADRSITQTLKLDGDEANKKGKPLYRLIQGSHARDVEVNNRCQALTERSVKRLAPLCGQSSVKKKLGMERAHTMPFPGIFSWSSFPIGSGPRFEAIKKDILTLNGDQLKAAIIIETQSVLKALGGKPNLEFVYHMLQGISNLALAKASETHHLFGMFNGFDHCSESEIMEGAKGSKGYKELIAIGLKAAIKHVEEGGRISLKDIEKLHTPYLQRTFLSTTERIQELNNELLFGSSLTSISEKELVRKNLSHNQLLKYFALRNTNAAVSQYVCQA